LFFSLRHYAYAGGVEGNSIIQWFREVDTESIGNFNKCDDDDFEVMNMKDNTSWYQPYVEDINRRIKVRLTPVRKDGVHGPTYQHIIEPLTIPFRLQEDITRCLQEFKSRGANFLLAKVDLMDPTVPPRNIRIICADKQLKVRNADTDKTEIKVRVSPGCIHVKAHQDVQRMFTATFPSLKTPAGPLPLYHLLADSLRSRDIIVLTLRSLAKSEF